MHVNVKGVAGSWIVALASVVNLAAADTRLIDAVKDRDVKKVQALVRERADVNATAADGATALHWAAHRDDVATADVLIRAGARPNVANDLGVTPLHLACTNRSTAMVRRLLTAGANPNATLLRGETVLMECARTGNADAVSALLKAGARVNEAEAINQQTALMWAVAQQHPKVVEALLEGGADIRARSRTYPQVVETGNRGGSGDVSTVLRGGSTPLLFAARVGDVESARLLIAAGADVNDALPDGVSALVLAAHSGHGSLGALLLEKGANPNAAEAGYTPLHAAIDRSDLRLVQALLGHGANPDLRLEKGTPARRDSNDFQLASRLIGSTAYLLAAKFVEVDIMRALSAGGADVQLTMPDGTTALMLVAGHGESRARTDFVRRNETRRQICVCDGGVVESERQVLSAMTVALAAGAVVNAVNRAGDTAIHFAAAMAFDSVVQLLADRGANLNVRNKRGLTPLALARGGSGRRGTPADDEAGPGAASASTTELLRRLGAAE